MTPDNTGEIQGGRFQPGESGNPAGRPRGARNRATLAVQELLDGEAEAITRKVIELAKDGNMAAIRLVIERILPPCRDFSVSLDLPPIKTVADIVLVQAAVMEAVGAGRLTPAEGSAIGGMAEQTRKAIETEALEARIALLEKRAAEYAK